MFPHDAIVRLNRLNPSDNLNRRMRHQLEIILFNDFRGWIKNEALEMVSLEFCKT